MTIAKKLAGVLVVLLGSKIAFEVWPILRVKAAIRSMDARFARVQVGDPAWDVESVIGTPHEVFRPQDHPFGVQQFYSYRVYLARYPVVKWSIGFDSTGNVISKHRDDDGC
jgi:hypothetical protein